MSSQSGPPAPYQYHGVWYDPIFPPSVLKGIENFEFNPDDVVLSGYPKTGTTWVQEMVWLVLHDVDTKAASETALFSRSPLMELHVPGDPLSGLDKATQLPKPRLVYSHLYYPFFSKSLEKVKPKAICELRNPKDTLVSYYHFLNSIPVRKPFKDFEEYLQLYRKKELPQGDWFDHVLSWWPNHVKDNFLFLKYEGIKADHAGTVRKIAQFLGKTLTEEQVNIIVTFTSFGEMKKKKKMEGELSKLFGETLGTFTRKAVVGDWKNHFSADQAALVDQDIKERLSGTGLQFSS